MRPRLPGKRIFLLLSVITFAFALTGTTAYAQGAAGISTTLTGSVVDTSGAPVPGADIVATHAATQATNRAVTNKAGRFTIPAVAPGTYVVTISMSGFKPVVLSDVVVNIAAPAHIKPVVLEVGSASETKTMPGGADMVQVHSGTLTTTLTKAQIDRTPAASRNGLDLAMMLPGVNTTTVPRNSNVMGLPPGALNVTIDGLSTPDNLLKSTVSSSFWSMVSPRLDAVEEVSITSAAAGADSTGQGAAQIRFRTRTGTNRFSGSVYDYMRRTSWNTNYWFNQFGTYPALPNDDGRIDTYGFRVGGPIVADKAFYFFNYEQFRQPSSVARVRTVLTANALAGLFTYPNAGGAQIDLYKLAARNGFTSTPDPTIQQILTAINATTGHGNLSLGPNAITNTLTFQNTSDTTRTYPTGRVDYNLNANNRLSASVFIQDYVSRPDIMNVKDAAFPGFPMQGDQTSWRPAVTVNWRSMFGTSLVNELYGGYTGWTATHFADNITADQFPGGIRLNLPLVSTPYASLDGEIRKTPLLNIEDSLHWTKGNHAVTMGGSLTRVSSDDSFQYYVQNAGIGFYTAIDPASAMFTTANFPGATSADLDGARQLYALLTGRMTSMNNTAYVDPVSGQYVYMGPSQSLLQQSEFGTFVQDQWKVKPNLTLNGGLRWEVQKPFTSQNDSLTQLVSYNMVYGISGTDATGNPNYFAPGTTAGSPVVQVQQLTPGQAAYNTDWNNFAPSAGVAWRPSVMAGGWPSKLLGADPVLRFGYSRAYVREGLLMATDALGYNPGGHISVSPTFCGNANFGSSDSCPPLLRAYINAPPPAFPASPTYPLTPSFLDSINAFYPDTQTPWVHSFNASFERTIGKDTAVDIRYVGTRSRGGWVDSGRNINELDLVENGFMTEFQHAQANYLTNERTYGWNTAQGNSFKYNGLPGQFPLPIFQASYSAVRANQAGDVTRYTSSQYSNPTYLAYLAPTNPAPASLAASLFSASLFRNNGVSAGLPTNFWYMNPAINGGVWVTGRPEDGLTANSDAAQIEVRRRMSGGLLVQASYQYLIRDEISRNLSVRVGPAFYDQGNPRHTFKFNWAYDLPFGQGKRFASGISRNMNRLVGGWSFDGFARIQSGNVLDFGNYLLVGMSDADLQAAYRLRFAPDGSNPNITRVFMLPEDIILNTIKAFGTSYASPSGYAFGAPQGRYFAPVQSTGCLEIYTGSCGTPIHHYVTGPGFVRFDIGFGKRVDITGRLYGEFRLEVLNVFDAVNFLGTTTIGGPSVNSYAATSAYRDPNGTADPGGRLLQLAWRLSW